MWAELLGFGDFYYELGVQLVEACLASRQLNGGLMELGALRAAVERRRGSRSDPVSEDDIVRAVRKLKVGGHRRLNSFTSSVYEASWCVFLVGVGRGLWA